MSVCVSPSIHMEKLSSIEQIFHEIWYFSTFQKSVIKPSSYTEILTRITNTLHAGRPMYIYDNISLISSWMRNVSDETYRENENTHFMFNNFFLKIVPFYYNVGE